MKAIPQWGLGPFVRPEGGNPVIRPNKDSSFACPMQKAAVCWEARHTFNPAAVVKDGKVYVLYRAEDDSGKGIGSFSSRLGQGVSDDGITFTRRAAPVFFPADDAQKEVEWTGGCEDPRIVKMDDGGYLMTYTQWDGKCARIGIATSHNLLDWEKHGNAFSTVPGGRYNNKWAKSGVIVCRVHGDNLVATKVNGTYLMYWGESPIYAATSDDLIHWRPIENAKGELLPVLSPREGLFDSALTEPGPPCLLTDKGIVMLYNGKNGSDGDKELGKGAYSGGQALLDPADPTKVVDRTTAPFFKPELPFEKTGQYAAGTTFIEGLVPFKGRWFLYYGCADTFVGVAVFAPRHTNTGNNAKTMCAKGTGAGNDHYDTATTLTQNRKTAIIQL